MNPENDRYAELKAFLAEWFRPLESSDGCTEEEIAAAETRLGFRLPDALRECYSLIGKCEDLTGLVNRMIRLNDLKIVEDDLPFWDENQGVWQVVIDKAEWEVFDPPVEFVFDNQRDGDDKRNLLSQIVLLLVAIELVNWQITVLGEADWGKAELGKVRARSAPTPYPILNENGFRYDDGALIYIGVYGQVAIERNTLANEIAAMQEEP